MFVSTDILHEHLVSQLSHLKSRLMYKGANTAVPKDEFHRALDSVLWRFLKTAEDKKPEVPSPTEQVGQPLKPPEGVAQSLEEALNQELQQPSSTPAVPKLEQGTVPPATPAVTPTLQPETTVPSSIQTPSQPKTTIPSATQTSSQPKPSIPEQTEQVIPQPPSRTFDPSAALIPTQNLKLRQDFEELVKSLRGISKFDLDQQKRVLDKAISYLKAGEVGLAQELMKTLVSLARPAKDTATGITIQDVILFARRLSRLFTTTATTSPDVNLNILNRTLMETILDRNRLKDFTQEDPMIFTEYIASFLFGSIDTDEFDSILARLGVINEFKHLREYRETLLSKGKETEVSKDKIETYKRIHVITLLHSLNKLKALFESQGINFDIHTIQTVWFRHFGDVSLTSAAKEVLGPTPYVFNNLSAFIDFINAYGKAALPKFSVIIPQHVEALETDLTAFSYLFILNLPRLLDLGAFEQKNQRDVVMRFLHEPTRENWYSLVDTLLDGRIDNDLFLLMRSAGLKVLPKSPLRSKDSALTQIHENPTAVIQQDFVKFLRELTREGYIQIPKPLLDKLELWNRERKALGWDNNSMFNQAGVLYVLTQLYHNGILFNKFGVSGNPNSDAKSPTLAEFLEPLINKSNIFAENPNLGSILSKELLRREFTITPETVSRTPLPSSIPAPAPTPPNTLEAFSFFTNQQEFYYELDQSLSSRGYTPERLANIFGAKFQDSYEKLKLGIATTDDIRYVAVRIRRLRALPKNARDLLAKFAIAAQLPTDLFLEYLNRQAFLANVANSRRILYHMGQLPGNEEVVRAGTEMLDLLKQFAMARGPETMFEILKLLDGQNVSGRDYVTGRWIVHAIHQYGLKPEPVQQLLEKEKEKERRRQEELQRQMQEQTRAQSPKPAPPTPTLPASAQSPTQAAPSTPQTPPQQVSSPSAQTTRPGTARTTQTPPQQVSSPSAQTTRPGTASTTQKPTGTQAPQPQAPSQPAGGPPSIPLDQQVINWFNKLSPLGRLALFLGIPLTTAGVILAMFGKPSAFAALLLGLGALGAGMYYETLKE